MFCWGILLSFIIHLGLHTTELYISHVKGEGMLRHRHLSKWRPNKILFCPNANKPYYTRYNVQNTKEVLFLNEASRSD